jgi:hypothetical protein
MREHLGNRVCEEVKPRTATIGASDAMMTQSVNTATINCTGFA